MCERQSRTNRDLGTHNAITTIEALSKHMHRSSLSIRNTLTTTKQLTNNGFDGGAAH
jgi:hypothetical protein